MAAGFLPVAKPACHGFHLRVDYNCKHRFFVSLLQRVMTYFLGRNAITSSKQT